jgi:uncharacterized membrane protein
MKAALFHIALMIAAGLLWLVLDTRDAAADFRLCNTTTSRVGVAIGYKDEKEGWISEGWWNVPSQKCEVLLAGDLVARYYYVHAVDYDRGGEWGGKAMMCTDDKEFIIRGVNDCATRGYKQTGFFEVDTQEEKDWTVRLTDTIEGAEAGAADPQSGSGRR